MVNASNYTVMLNCDNCEKDIAEAIPKGTTIEDWVAARECPNCGCQTLTRKVNLTPTTYPCLEPYGPPYNPYPFY